LAPRANRIPRKQPSKVDQLERIPHVRDISLKPRGEFLTLENVGSDGKVLREVRIDAAAIEIEVIDHRLAVFCRISAGTQCVPSMEFPRQGRMEERLHQLVCSGRLDLPTAQREIATDWICCLQEVFLY
jgi:hypothetical protein